MQLLLIANLFLVCFAASHASARRNPIHTKPYRPMTVGHLTPLLPGTYHLEPKPLAPSIPNPHNLPSSPGTLRYWRKWAIEVNASLKKLGAEYDALKVHNYRPHIDQQGDPAWLRPIRQHMANFAEERKLMWKIEKTLEMRERARRHLSRKGWDIDTDPFIEGTDPGHVAAGGHGPGQTWNETRPETKKEEKKRKKKHHGTKWHAQVGGHIHKKNGTQEHGGHHGNRSKHHGEWFCVPMDPGRKPFHLKQEEVTRHAFEDDKHPAVEQHGQEENVSPGESV